MRISPFSRISKGKRLNLSQQATEVMNLRLERLRNPRVQQLFKGINHGQKITGSLALGQISRSYKRLAKRAGLDKELIEQISGHSLRIEHAQDMVNFGESMPIIISKGRWSKSDLNNNSNARVTLRLA